MKPYSVFSKILDLLFALGYIFIVDVNGQILSTSSIHLVTLTIPIVCYEINQHCSILTILTLNHVAGVDNVDAAFVVAVVVAAVAAFVVAVVVAVVAAFVVVAAAVAAAVDG